MTTQTINTKNPLIVVWESFDEFWQRTSISGISNAGSTKSAFRRTCWMIIFTVFVAITFTGFRGVLNDYFTYPVITSVTIVRQDQVAKSVFRSLIFKHISYISNFVIFITKTLLEELNFFDLLDEISCSNCVQSKPSSLRSSKGS